jgi:hypothetical protein
MESYPKGEIPKRKLAVAIVNDEVAAEVAIDDVGSSKDRKWHEGLLTRTPDNHMGAFELFKREAQEIIRVLEAGRPQHVVGRLAARWLL